MKTTCSCCSQHAASPSCSPQGGWRQATAPLLSLQLLLVGMLCAHFGASWFLAPGVRLAWYVVAFLPVGLPVMHKAWHNISQRDVFNEFTLMSVAAIGAFCIGEYPEAVAVMLFYTVGEMLQDRAVVRASGNISRLLDVRPQSASVWRDGMYVSVAPREVQVGEQLEVKPGGRVPLDGYLLDAEAQFDTSALTGESLPRTLQCDEEVLAGMIATGSLVRIRVSKPYDQSALARILELVRDAADRKAPAELFIRRFARYYTPVVAILALLIVLLPACLGFFVPAFHYVFGDWLYRGLVFLVISCPCALVISVPLGYFGGIGAASRLGILCKGSNYLDALSQVQTVVFDKTGTLTTGRFEITDVQAVGIPVDELLTYVLSVEQKSTHPVAQAVVRYAVGRQVVAVAVDQVEELAGRGVRAVIDGRSVAVGNVRMLTEEGMDVPVALTGTVATVVVCMVNGRYAGHLLLSDSPKPDAGQAVTRLSAMGVTDVRILSGDKQEIVDHLAARLGIRQAYGNLLPQDKVSYVEQLTAVPGHMVAFVGDGMNDAPVLALSDVGIAMGGLGSDAAIESADVVIQTDQPSKVAVAIAVGRATRRIVKQNIFGAITVKLLVLLAGAWGCATLWEAVFADVGVALLAVLNAVRILNKKFD